MTTITLNLDTKEITKDLQKRANEMQKKQIDSQLNELFVSGGGYWKQPKGLFYAQIEQTVEQIIEKLFDENAAIEKLEARTEHHFKIMLDEAIELAAKHRARKLAFHALNEHLKALDDKNE